MNQTFNLVAYSEECARKLKRVSHSDTQKRFFKANNLGDLDGFLDEKYNKQPPFIVAIDAHSESNISEYCSRQFHTVLVLDKDSDGVKSVARSFKSKLIKDRENASNGLSGLDIATISDTSFGPVDKLEGRMITFYVADANGLDYDEEEWGE